MVQVGYGRGGFDRVGAGRVVDGGFGAKLQDR